MIDPAEEFIVKRAFRRGLVTRRDVVRALGVSTATATRLIALALERRAEMLDREGHALKPRPLATPPDYASEDALLHELDTGRHDPARTGLFDSELPVVYVSWTNSMPPKPGILSLITQAIREKRVIRVVYIGLRADEELRERRILPLALERMNDQWRVIAQDVERDGAPIRVFVLSRILDAQPDRGSKPRGFVHQGHTDSMTELNVTLNPKFTPRQKEVLARELRVENGKVRVATRSVHEFARRFADTPPNAEAVWPPIVIKGGK